jgi:asparagine N-glycosylation enzyme membrane subunit Stt3
MARWLYSHLPVSMAIAASGAAMVSLVGHAGDDRATAATTWLLAAAVATMLASLVLTMTSLQDFAPLRRVYRPLVAATLAGAAIALLVGWWRPAPWKLVLALTALPSIVWFYAVDRFLRHGGIEISTEASQV